MADTSNSLWFKDAIIYQAHVRAFFDSTNDGVGDFNGLTQKLEYLESLGINALWLLPFYPSPLRDDGYDIADYENIHPSYGTLADFDRFIAEAHRRQIRVITELVINHTSDQHPWFQAARRAPAGSPEREFYVWSDTNKKYQDVRIIFTDTEKSNWTWDDTAKAYYWHRFFHHQPDLNFDNPAVLEAVIKVMRFWLDRGVDGLRLDAVPYLIEREGTICENLEETHAILKQIRRELDASYPDRMLLAEANQWPADVRPYFGDGDECHMAFHFPLMPRMFMAVRQEDRHPIIEIMRQTPEIPENCQWAMFLRNHDELTLEMVSDEERDYMYQAYASDPQMRINVGIRRRLAPLLENSRRRIELLHGLLFSMPGTPVIYYGDEIGMGDNIYLGDRNGVRTPMQWTGDRNGGFSQADPARLYAPPVMDPVYGYQAINVEAQSRSPYSLLNWIRRMIALRKQFTVFGRGALAFVPSHNRKVLVYTRSLGEETILCLANLSRSVQPVELDLAHYKGMVPVEMLGLTEFPAIGDLPYFLTVGPYAFYWFRLQPAPELVPGRTTQEPAAEAQQMPGLLVGAAWETLLEGNVRTLIERERLLPFLQRQRWFGGKARRARAARFIDWGVRRRGPQPLFLTLVEVEYDDGGREQYFLPLTICGSADARTIDERAAHAIVANITGARKGILFDAVMDDGFAQTILDEIAQQDQTKTRRGSIKALHTAAFADLRGPADEKLRIRRLGAEQSNTSIVYGDRLIMKLFRRIQAGINPDFEIGRQLTEKVRFSRVPAVAGALEYSRPGEPATTLAMMQQLVESQADGWTHAMGDLGRYYDYAEGHGAPPAVTAPSRFTELAEATPPPRIQDTLGSYLAPAQRLGRRTAEMHIALAADGTDAAFAPEPFTQDDVLALSADAVVQAERALETLDRWLEEGDTGTEGAAAEKRLPPDVEAQARRLARSRDALLDRIRSAPQFKFVSSKIRVHGDYHLGQVLWVEGDFYLLDFEGEPARSLAVRRQKQSPLKDVAGMLRSFSYAAYAGLFTHAASRPAAFAQLEPAAHLWQTWVSAAFLRGYFETAGNATFLPADLVQRDALLRLFMLDKALYELNYELNNRPDWVRIPLWGIFDLL